MKNGFERKSDGGSFEHIVSSYGRHKHRIFLLGAVNSPISQYKLQIFFEKIDSQTPKSTPCLFTFQNGFLSNQAFLDFCTQRLCNTLLSSNKTFTSNLTIEQNMHTITGDEASTLHNRRSDIN